MKEYILHTLLFLKKQLFNKIYISFLILLPVCMFIAGHYLANEPSASSIPVGYYFDFDDEKLANELSSNFNEVSGRLNFIRYTDLEEMLNETSSSRLECSYVLTKDLVKNIAKDDYKKIVLVYKSPQTIISEMINELVFAAIYRAAGDDTLYYYMAENTELFSGTVDINNLLTTLTDEYSGQLTQGNTFSLNFSVYEGNANTLQETTTIDTPVNKMPTHGIIAIFLFLCLLLACTDYSTENEKGTLLKLTPLNRIKISSCIIHSWLLPAVISSLICIILLHDFSSITEEIINLFFYYALLLIFGIVMSALIKKSLLLTALIPLLIIGSLIFTPVIIDISAFIPLANFIEKLFLPYYYIAVF